METQARMARMPIYITKYITRKFSVLRCILQKVHFISASDDRVLEVEWLE